MRDRKKNTIAIGTLVALALVVAWTIVQATTNDRPSVHRSVDGCPVTLSGLPPFWAVSRDVASGSYGLDEIRLCPDRPIVLRHLHDDIGWIGAGADRVVVVVASGRYDKIASFDGKKIRPIPGVDPKNSAFSPAVSSTGDVAFIAFDPRTDAESVDVLRRGSSRPTRLYAAPNGRKLSTPSWNAKGQLITVERPPSRRAGAVHLVFLDPGKPALSARLVPLGRPNATTVQWLDDERVVVGDYAAAPEARPALVDIDQRTTRLLPTGLMPVADVPSNDDAFLVRDGDRRLILLHGHDLEDAVVLGAVDNKIVGQGVFVRRSS